jgi:hypothetical protein
MNFEAYFTFMFIVVAFYVIFGNYLYFRKVIPELGKAPGLLPSTQIKHMDEYLKNIKAITLVILILMVPGFLHILGMV